MQKQQALISWEGGGGGAVQKLEREKSQEGCGWRAETSGEAVCSELERI